MAYINTANEKFAEVTSRRFGLVLQWVKLLCFLGLYYVFALIFSRLVGGEYRRAVGFDAVMYIAGLWFTLIPVMYLWIRTMYPKALRKHLGIKLSKAPDAEVSKTSGAEIQYSMRDSLIFLKESEVSSSGKAGFALFRRLAKIVGAHAAALIIVLPASFFIAATAHRARYNSSLLAMMEYVTPNVSSKVIEPSFWLMVVLVLGMLVKYGFVRKRILAMTVVALYVLALIFDSNRLASDGLSIGEFLLIHLIGISLMVTFMMFFFSVSGSGAVMVSTVLGFSMSILILLVAAVSSSGFRPAWVVLAIFGAAVILVQSFLLVDAVLFNYKFRALSDVDVSVIGGMFALFYFLAIVSMLGVEVSSVLRESGRAKEAEWARQVWFMALGGIYIAIVILLRQIGLGKKLDSNPVSLLVLRVFGKPKQSRELFEHLLRKWRNVGPVNIVSGHEMAMETMTPRTCLLFLMGRIKSICFSGGEDFLANLTKDNSLRFSDGFYAANDIVCSDAAWREAFLYLLDKAQRVVMDLRNLSSSNRGAVFELEQVMLKKSASEYLLLVDDTTDFSQIESAIKSVSENLNNKHIRCFVIKCDKNSERTAKSIYNAFTENHVLENRLEP